MYNYNIQLSEKHVYIWINKIGKNQIRTVIQVIITKFRLRKLSQLSTAFSTELPGS